MNERFETNMDVFLLADINKFLGSLYNYISVNQNDV